MDNQSFPILLNRKEIKIIKGALQHIGYLTRHQAGINEFFYNEYNIPEKPELITWPDMEALKTKLGEMS